MPIQYCSFYYNAIIRHERDVLDNRIILRSHTRYINLLYTEQMDKWQMDRKTNGYNWIQPPPGRQWPGVLAVHCSVAIVSVPRYCECETIAE